MGIGSAAYKLVFILHILAVVVGFGGVMLNGVYGSEAKKRKGPTGHAVGEANLAVTDIALKVIMTVPVWGALLVILSDGVWKFSQAWVGLAIVLFTVVYSFARAVQHKSQERMVHLAGELAAGGPPPASASGPPPQVAQMEDLEKKLKMGGIFLSVMVVVLIAVMVFKPGI